MTAVLGTPAPTSRAEQARLAAGGRSLLAWVGSSGRGPGPEGGPGVRVRGWQESLLLGAVTGQRP